MKNKLWLLYPVLALLLAFSLVVPASAAADGDPVPLPHNFYGSLTIGTEPAPAETEVEARGEGVMTTEANPITTTVEGEYGGPGPTDPKLEVQGYIADGATITFWVNGVVADQTAEWHSAELTELNLTVGEAPQYTLTVASTAGGEVTDPGEPGPFTYDAGTMVDLVAVPDTDYEFVNWTGDVGTMADTNAASTTITMNGDYSITANFAVITYELTVASTAGGSVTTPGEETFTYGDGAVVDLVAVAVEGYQFVSWTGDVGTVGDVNAASTTITMDADYSITANFGEIGVTYTLTISSTTGGSVTEPVEAISTHDSGTVVNLLAVADTGYQFANWTGDTADIANANAASTTITMNGDYSITANFVEVTGDLGDLIDGTDPGETLVLEAGTYTGNVTINQPITITGTEGETIISGGITIGELTGSNVTIENLTITDYTDFGIRIVKVRAVDIFTIRNNTILGVVGVEGSEIGIKVGEVEGMEVGGILEIVQNTISGNDIGIKLLEAVTRAHIAFNNIVDNEVGLELLAIGEHWVGAARNWWGDISGPEEENWNPGGIGDKIELTDGLGYFPWLTRDFQTVLDDNIAYFGLPAVELNTGWNIISTPVALDPVVEWVDSDNISRTGVDTWGDYIALGDGLSTDNTSPAYRFDGESQAWVTLSSDDSLDPCDAIYVRMAEDDIAPILFSPNVSVPSKELYSGWNLVSLAWIPSGEIYGMPADEALVTVEDVSGGLTGYKLVVSPGVNTYESTWIHIAGQPIEPWTDSNVWPPPDGYMLITSGYWVFMLNDGTLAGFAFTPVSLSLPPPPAEG